VLFDGCVVCATITDAFGESYEAVSVYLAPGRQTASAIALGGITPPGSRLVAAGDFNLDLSPDSPEDPNMYEAVQTWLHRW